MSADELDVWVNELIDSPCDGDSCPIDFGGDGDT